MDYAAIQDLMQLLNNALKLQTVQSQIAAASSYPLDLQPLYEAVTKQEKTVSIHIPSF